MQPDGEVDPEVTASTEERVTDDLVARAPIERLGDQLRDLLGRDGPFVSLYWDPADSDHRATVDEWRVDADLSAAQDQVLGAALDEADTPAEPTMQALLVAADGTAVELHHPEPPGRPVMEVGASPRLGPLLEAAQRLLHHLVVVAGTDADLEIVSVPRQGEPTSSRFPAAGAGDERIEADVEAIVEAVVGTDTRFVVICAPAEVGPRLRRLVRAAVPVETVVVLITTDGGDTEATADEIVREVASLVAGRTVEALRLWRYEETHGLAVDGIVETLRALQEGRATLVLVHDDPDDDRQAWFGTGTHRIALDLADATPISPDETLHQARLVDVLLRSAVLQRCAIRMVPMLPDSRLEDGIGAVLTDTFV